VDPLDPVAIARAVEGLLADPGRAERMGARGRVAVETEYNWTAEGQRLVAAYHRLVGSRHPAGEERAR
jgi:glycosyltransferase involved in cell wall biosynthesis